MNEDEGNKLVPKGPESPLKRDSTLVRRGLDDLGRVETRPIEIEVNFRWLGSELMTLTPLGSNQFRVECSPAFFERPTIFDVIEAHKLPNRNLKFRRIVKRSGLKQHRYLLPKAASDSQEFAQFVRWLESLGGVWQIVFGGWLILDVPSELPVNEIEEKLRPACSATSDEAASKNEYPKKEVRFRLPKHERDSRGG